MTNPSGAFTPDSEGGELPSRQILQFDAFTLIPEAGELRKDGRLVRLRPQPFKLLLMLAGRPNRVVTREEIQRELWSQDTFVDFEHGINSCVRQIRRALDDDAETPRFIETIPKKGYRLTAEVSRAEVTDARPSGRRWPLAATAAVIGLLLIGWLVARFLPRPEEVPAAETRPCIAVLYFENRSGEPDLEKILVEMLTTNLSRYESLEVVSSQRLFDILNTMGERDGDGIDKGVATEVAEQAEAETMLVGSIVKIGDRIRINGQLADVETGSNIGAAQAEGSKVDDIFDMTDQLTEQVVHLMGVASPDFESRVPKTAEVTTSSYAAYRFYQRGLEDAYQYHFRDAIEKFKRAVDIDPTFSMAHLQLVFASIRLAAANILADRYPARQSLELARAHAEKATDFERRYMVVLGPYLNLDFQAAADTAADLAARYPKDKMAGLILATNLFYSGDFNASIQAANRTLEIDPTFGLALNVLAYSHSMNGDHEKAVATINRYLEIQPDGSNPYFTAWEIYMRAGRYDSARAIASEALRINPNWINSHSKKGVTDILSGRVDEAMKAFEQLKAPWRPRNWGSGWRGFAHLYGGKYEEAMVDFRKAVDTLHFRRSLAWFEMGKLLALRGDVAGALSAFSEANRVAAQRYHPSYNPVAVMSEYLSASALMQNGDYARAETHAANIQQIVTDGNYQSIFLDYFHLLKADHHLNRGDSTAAEQELGKVGPVNRQFSPHFHLLMGKIKAAKGETSVAAGFYEDLCRNIYMLNPRLGGSQFDYFLGCSMSNYYLGRLYEDAGKPSLAIEYYEKALDIWKDADADMPAMLDATVHLKKLKASSD
jgi:tetratricopeptide (TPR) repeat protein/DNA-binding winged helix-turn-helix (wHTH) protein/TolB-like protein